VRARLGLCALLLGTLGLAGCNPQIWPKPMDARRSPLPPGALWQEGPEEVTLVRLADPVKVRPPGQNAGFPVLYYDKSRRVRAGSGVLVDAGGRAEILWPSGTSVTLTGPGAGVVGSTSRGDPTFVFEGLGLARLNVVSPDQVQLLGGSILTGDSGPYLVRRSGPETIQVRNQSKEPLMVAFRTTEFEIGPGQQIDLPLISGGAAPTAGDGFRVIDADGYWIEARGDVQSQAGQGGLRLQASGPHEIRGLGVRMKLSEGDSVTFTGLGREGRGPVPPAPDEPEFPGSEFTEPESTPDDSDTDPPAGTGDSADS